MKKIGLACVLWSLAALPASAAAATPVHVVKAEGSAFWLPVAGLREKDGCGNFGDTILLTELTVAAPMEVVSIEFLPGIGRMKIVNSEGAPLPGKYACFEEQRADMTYSLPAGTWRISVPPSSLPEDRKGVILQVYPRARQQRLVVENPPASISAREHSIDTWFPAPHKSPGMGDARERAMILTSAPRALFGSLKRDLMNADLQLNTETKRPKDAAVALPKKGEWVLLSHQDLLALDGTLYRVADAAPLVEFDTNAKPVVPAAVRDTWQDFDKLFDIHADRFPSFSKKRESVRVCMSGAQASFDQTIKNPFLGDAKRRAAEQTLDAARAKCGGAKLVKEAEQLHKQLLAERNATLEKTLAELRTKWQ